MRRVSTVSGRGWRAALAALSVASLSIVALPGGAGATVPARPPDGIVRAGIKFMHPPARPNLVTSLQLQSTAVAGSVSQVPKVYLVFWGSQWSTDPAGAAPALQGFFRGLFGAPDTWGGVLSQYCSGAPAGTVLCGTSGNHVIHATSSVLGGVWFDNAAPSPASATASQIAAEAVSAATHFGNTTQAPNLNAQYVVASPTGSSPDGWLTGNFCAWHSSIFTAHGTIAYTNLPYVPDAGVGACTTLASPALLDGYFSTESHEYAETVTDFWPSNGWTDSSGNEIGDLCDTLDARLTLGLNTYDVQGIWSNIDNKCVTASSAPPGPAPRMLARVVGGNAFVKEGGLTSPWVMVASGVTAIAVASDPVHGPVIGVINASGFYAKQGGITGPWTHEAAAGVSAISVATDATNGPLLGMISATGFHAKQGSVASPWILEAAPGVTAISVATDATNGALLGMVSATGFSVKRGLAGSWTHEGAAGVTAISVATDATNGPLLGVVNAAGFYAKRGVTGSWTLEKSGAVSAISVATDAAHGPLLGVVNAAGFSAKQGSLTSPWTVEAPAGVSAISVATDASNGPLLGQINATGLFAKQSIVGAWTQETMVAPQRISVAD